MGLVPQVTMGDPGMMEYSQFFQEEWILVLTQDVVEKSSLSGGGSTLGERALKSKSPPEKKS